MQEYQIGQGGVYEDTTNIRSVWDAMDLNKGDLISRSEEYARLTIPSICAPSYSYNTEQEKANVFIGARIVNFLANKIINVIFPHDRPFFKVDLSPEAEFQLSAEVPQEEIDAAKTEIMIAGMRIAKFGISKLKMGSYRPKAILGMKHLIVTGNVAIRRLPDGTRVEYGVRDFGVYRHMNGEPYDVILRDVVRFDSLDPIVQDEVRRKRIGVKDSDSLNMFSRWRWRPRNNKWEYTQAVEDVHLSTFQMIAKQDFPVIVLAWSRARGENYGRGLVEDNIAQFSAIDVSTTALLDLFGIAADVKFLVNPGSVLDVVELANSGRGTYHVGAEGDITSPNVGQQKLADIQTLFNSIQTWERSLSAAFLMTSGTIRDAERVTAEEIRFYAQEIESEFGGLYSNLSVEWQQKEAEWAVQQAGRNITKSMQISVTTGMDALSQDAALLNLQYSINDLGLINQVPEEIRAELNTRKIAEFIFANRNLPYQQFALTSAEIAEKQQQMAALQEQALAQETQALNEREAAKAAVKQQ